MNIIQNPGGFRKRPWIYWWFFFLTAISAGKLLSANHNIRAVEVLTIFACGCLFGVALVNSIFYYRNKGIENSHQKL